MALTLSARNLVKRYGGVVALRDGNLDIQSGEVVALVGANGSGKSTLSKIIAGAVVPNGGQLLLDGVETRFADPQAARKRGIEVVYQELSLIPDMSVAENIWLSNEPLRLGIAIHWAAMRERTQALLSLFEGTISAGLEPDTPITALSPDERQVVEILKSISSNPRLIILDEATASLDSSQVNRLFELIQQWKTQGKGVIFITHRMEEIFRVADQVTVLRNGESVGTVEIATTDEHTLVDMMIKDVATLGETRTDAVPDDTPVRLEVSGLSSGRLKDVSLRLREGELLGLGGLQGQGQVELLLALFGIIPYSGNVVLNGKPVHFHHPNDAMKHDVAFVPGDRGAEGLLFTRSILENLQLPSWGKYGLIHKYKLAEADALAAASDLGLVYSSLQDPVSSLSGGNAQKVVIGKWLLRQPKLLLLNDPTKGVDVGAKGEFYALLKNLTDQGTAILFYSSDDNELLGLCNRLLVLREGTISAELSGEDLTEENLVSASMGTANELG
ncbi:MAG: sugar ABC transporter ATP-binding protein [Anaerolineae bacterium]|nr:sugar ABC transporter ATP-binding protein [Anaerolineae bacterium]